MITMKTAGKKNEMSWSDINSRCIGNWPTILGDLCEGVFEQGFSNVGRHVDCPLPHGGKGDFRFLPNEGSKIADAQGHAIAICTCGSYNGQKLLSAYRGWGPKELKTELSAYFQGKEGARVVPKVPAKPNADAKATSGPSAKEVYALEQNRKLWANSLELTEESPVLAYYKNRGLSTRAIRALIRSGNVRWLPYYGYFEPNPAPDIRARYRRLEDKGEAVTALYVEKLLEQTANAFRNQEDAFDYLSDIAKNPDFNPVRVGTFPAILAAMRNESGDLVTIHRTWLSEDFKAKAPVKVEKKLYFSAGVSGSAIQLITEMQDDSEITCLGLAEGIENALSAWQLAHSGYFSPMGEMPVWACYCAGNIPAFTIPARLLPTLKKVVVFADRDRSKTGENAANEFKRRMALQHPAIEVHVFIPDIEGWDWNDEARRSV